MTKFTLVNPYIQGSLTTETDNKSPLGAAKALYSKLSKHFKNNVPSYYFSIMDENETVSHFHVTEKKSGKEVNYTIEPAKMSKTNEKKMVSIVTKKMKEQKGGKTFLKDESDSSDSESSSSTSSFSPRNLPLYIDPISTYLYTPSYIIDAIVPDTVIVDQPLYYVPSIVLDNGYTTWYWLGP